MIMQDTPLGVSIKGTGFFVPPKIVTNEDFIKMGLETSNEWIVERTGIKTRHICEADMSSGDMGFHAAEQAIKNSGVSPDAIELVIVATSTPDHPLFPSNACIIQNRLGLKNCASFDVSAACSGFSYALTTAQQYIKAGTIKTALVVATDCLSKYLDWQDRSICVLFGDGAGAVVLTQDNQNGILYSKLYSDGSQAEILMVKGGGSRNPMSKEILEAKENLISMNGRAVFKVAVDRIVPAVELALEKSGLTVESLDWFIPHQANLRIIHYVADKLGLPHEKIWVNLDRYGNTSAASIPIGIAEAAQTGALKPGQTILTVGFGAGFTWGVNVFRWQ